MPEPLLSVRGLVTELRTAQGPVRALDGVDLDVPPDRTVGLVGESGCGKSLAALSILRLLPEGARIASGTVRFAGADLARASEAELRAVRGRRVAMVFQEPMTSLNPVLTVGEQISDVVRHHLGLGRAEAAAKAVELLRVAGVPAPAERAAQYPHQLSGGLRQRAMIALALSCGPQLLIADEPTTALDVTLQAELLQLLRTLQRERHLSVLLITHDLALVSRFADELAVMYAGRVVERGATERVLRAPRHPYTHALLQSLPPRRVPGEPRRPLPTIPGAVPAAWNLPSGCRFRDRCNRATEVCAGEPPPEVDGAACYHPLEAA